MTTLIDLPGEAIYDYWKDKRKQRLWVHDNFGPKELMPVSAYFRDEENMPEREQTALQHCKGTILDIGAGAGSHSLALQQRGLEVTALDISPLCVQTMKERGLKDVVCTDIFHFQRGQYDTLLLLMNGIGLAGTLSGLRRLLQHFRKLLLPGGSLLFDSSDIRYMYEDGHALPEHYIGEVSYLYEYKGRFSDTFKWLFIDFDTLSSIAQETGWKATLLCEDKEGQYLARLG